MNIFYLKKIRKSVWNKYKIQRWESLYDSPWHICDKPDSTLPFSNYSTYEEALSALMEIWRTEAKKFLFENQSKRKSHQKRYPW